MNLLLILTLFINYLCINGAVVPVTSVYNVIKQSANDPKLNCSEVRSTLIEPQETFLTKCLYNSVTSIDADKTESDHLCLLYYSNVMSLCKISIDLPPLNLATKLSEDAKVHQELADVCGTMVNETKSFVYDEVKDSVGLTLKKLDSKKYCASLCLMENWYIKSECILNAFMLKTASSLMMKSFKPLHTVAVQDPSELHQEPKKEEPKIEQTAAQSNNADVKAVVSQSAPVSVEKADVPPIKIETTAEQNADQPKVNLDEKFGVVNSLDTEKSKLPDPNEVIDDTVKADLGTEILQSNHPVDESKKPNSVAEKNTIENQQNTNKQDKANEKTENISIEKLTPNAQQSSLGKTTIKLSEGKEPEEKKPEEKQPEEKQPEEKQPEEKQPEEKQPEEKKPEGNKGEILDNDFTLVDGEKQVTNNKNEVQNPIAEKNSFDNNLEKEDPPADLGGEDDLTAAINDVEEYPETPELALDNSGVPEVLPGNSAAVANEKPKSSEVKTKTPEKFNKPQETNEDDDGLPANYQNQSIDDSDSYFFSYFMMVCIMFICGYVAYHNKQKILALVVEGRRGRRTSRSRRPNSANYRKLDSNLEEAVTSSCNKNTTQIIY